MKKNLFLAKAKNILIGDVSHVYTLIELDQKFKSGLIAYEYEKQKIVWESILLNDPSKNDHLLYFNRSFIRKIEGKNFILSIDATFDVKPKLKNVSQFLTFGAYSDRKV